MTARLLFALPAVFLPAHVSMVPVSPAPVVGAMPASLPARGVVPDR